jgi:hypothetical protein
MMTVAISDFTNNDRQERWQQETLRLTAPVYIRRRDLSRDLNTRSNAFSVKVDHRVLLRYSLEDRLAEHPLKKKIAAIPCRQHERRELLFAR